MFYCAAVCSSLQSSNEESPLRFYRKKKCIYAFLKNLKLFYLGCTAILKLESVIVLRSFNYITISILQTLVGNHRMLQFPHQEKSFM